MKPEVSIIVPTYNAESFIRECISSIVNQSYVDWEVIVVDNFSTDRTIEIIDSLDDQRVRIYRFSNHGIIAASRNLGVSKSTGKFLAFLDADDIWDRKKLESTLPYLKQGYDLVSHGEVHFSESFSPDTLPAVIDSSRMKPCRSFQTSGRNHDT